MKTLMLALVVTVCLAALSGAQTRPPSLSPNTAITQCWSPTPEIAAEDRAACQQHRTNVMAAWRNDGSYYALLEIVEARLGRPEDDDAARRGGLGIRREALIDLLGGERLDRDYPNSRRDGFLVWSSQRALAEGSYLVVQFDKSVMAQSYYWVSE